jgi:predicted transcriptional regulator
VVRRGAIEHIVSMCTHEHTAKRRQQTLTVRISPDVKKRLGRLAGHTRRTSSYLAGEAIADFVDRELAIVEGMARYRGRERRPRHAAQGRNAPAARHR